MPDLILRPSDHAPGRPWALQLRRHDCCGPVEYHTIARLTEAEARDVVAAGAAWWLLGEPAAGGHGRGEGRDA